jgi:hypothetical protein
MVAALWAREAIQNLEMDLACGGQRQTIDAQIEAIALRHSIASRVTSWIAVAEEPTVDPREPVRVERIPQMVPYGMSAEGLGLMAFDAATARMHIGRAALSGSRLTALIPDVPKMLTARKSDILAARLEPEFERLITNLRAPLEAAREMADEELKRLQHVASEIDRLSNDLLRDLPRLDAPTLAATDRRRELLDRIERLLSIAPDSSLAKPLMAFRDRLRESIERLQPRPPLMLHGQILPTPDRPTTTIEIFMERDFEWAPAPTATLAGAPVGVVETGTTRSGKIPARSSMRVELATPRDQVARSGQVEIQNGVLALTVTLTGDLARS